MGGGLEDKDTQVFSPARRMKVLRKSSSISKAQCFVLKFRASQQSRKTNHIVFTLMTLLPTKKNCVAEKLKSLSAMLITRGHYISKSSIGTRKKMLDESKSLNQLKLDRTNPVTPHLHDIVILLLLRQSPFRFPFIFKFNNLNEV